ncbi:hypothetical protein IWZ00DRAFT_510817 [Phyllosticta capitalensis]
MSYHTATGAGRPIMRSRSLRAAAASTCRASKASCSNLIRRLVSPSACPMRRLRTFMILFRSSMLALRSMSERLARFLAIGVDSGGVGETPSSSRPCCCPRACGPELHPLWERSMSIGFCRRHRREGLHWRKRRERAILLGHGRQKRRGMLRLRGCRGEVVVLLQHGRASSAGCAFPRPTVSSTVPRALTMLPSIHRFLTIMMRAPMQMENLTCRSLAWLVLAWIAVDGVDCTILGGVTLLWTTARCGSGVMVKSSASAPWN